MPEPLVWVAFFLGGILILRAVCSAKTLSVGSLVTLIIGGVALIGLNIWGRVEVGTGTIGARFERLESDVRDIGDLVRSIYDAWRHENFNGTEEEIKIVPFEGQQSLLFVQLARVPVIESLKASFLGDVAPSYFYWNFQNVLILRFGAPPFRAKHDLERMGLYIDYLEDRLDSSTVELSQVGNEIFAGETKLFDGTHLLHDRETSRGRAE